MFPKARIPATVVCLLVFAVAISFVSHPAKLVHAAKDTAPHTTTKATCSRSRIIANGFI